MKLEQSIKVENLNKTYKGNIQALDGLSFEVDKGSIFGLIGPNGAGKSTAIKIMTTLTRADSGVVRIGDYDVNTEPNHVRKIIGCISQNSGVFREGTARENLILQGELYGMRGSKLKTRVSKLLDNFGLNEVADRIAATYSGGMLRKLDVALGLIHRPQILFLDEPTTGLDPEARSSLWEIILSMSKQENVTVLLTTHYLEEVDRLADKLAIVNAGKVIAEGTPASLKEALNEDMIHISLDSKTELQTDVIEKALSSLRNIFRVEIDGNIIKLRVANASSTLVDVLQVLAANQIHVLNTSIIPSTIDEVYLKYTKK
ncbi:ATP-binding cassette domain-containing protein [Tissierella carlieri]|uniref:ATP-binding cassette domain-containing protein n=1 Tax=Tissierella carlieri TaxID=689904 RepID=A0ABT1SD29_9FIRM|nr:ATP-binding cassette domain-containing protein [Tissierella carlieri]MCQ4924383.1 ATP-binding cassette domain-containing protein [Tissierella carlieri]